MPDDGDFATQRSTTDLTDHILAAIDELAARGTHEAFTAMLTVTSHAGERIGDAARALAANTSWTEVGQLTGTSKQAAWSRWRG
jgi:hypothetical protein